MDIQEICFGDFCTIEQKRYVGPNVFYSYKVVGRKKSNVWSDVPVDASNRKETHHDYMDDVVTVVCNNLDDRTVYQFRVSDLASVRKAQAIPEGFVLLPVDTLEECLDWAHIAKWDSPSNEVDKKIAHHEAIIESAISAQEPTNA